MLSRTTVGLCFALALALLPGHPCVAAGSDSRVPDLNGATRDPLQETGKKAVVLFFIAHDCPISNGYAPEINRICAEYGPRNVAFYLVYVDPDLPVAAARKHAQAYHYRCPALRDPDHKLVRKTGVTVTPEAAVLAPGGRPLYRGRIDDLYAELGVRRYQPTTRDLRAALDAILQGRPVPRPRTRAVGCFISHRPGATP